MNGNRPPGQGAGQAEPWHLDKRLARRAFEQAAAGYDEVAVLQREVADRMLERLDVVRLRPKQVLDVGCGTGLATAALARRYRGCRAVGLDLSEAMLKRARRRAPWFRGSKFVCGDAESLPFADASFELLYSNLTLQWCTDLEKTLTEFRRVLRPGGLVMFTTLGPDTLSELRQSWGAADEFSHVNGFIDMHDVGDVLMHTGWSEPVMDAERFTLTYTDVFALMRDLKGLGAHNVTAGRCRGLTGKGRLRQMQEAYEQFRGDGKLPATYEVVYGHAWQPDAAVRTSREVAFPVGGNLPGR